MATQTTTKTEGLYLHGPKVLELESRDLEAPQPDEIQIAIRSTTICGSDLHYFSHFRNGDITVKEPLCLGHESAGEITALGSEVHKNHPHLQEGQLVAVECGVPCGECDVCKLKRYNICPQLRFRSSGSKFPHYQGTLQKKINHPAQWVHKLPDALDCEIGALLEPLAVAVQAVDKAEKFALPSVHEDCLVFGAGAVGLLCCLAARGGMEAHRHCRYRPAAAALCRGEWLCRRCVPGEATKSPRSYKQDGCGQGNCGADCQDGLAGHRLACWSVAGRL